MHRVVVGQMIMRNDRGMYKTQGDGDGERGIKDREDAIKKQSKTFAQDEAVTDVHAWDQGRNYLMS